MQLFTLVATLFLASDAAHAVNIFRRKPTTEQRCAALIENGPDLALVPESLGDRAFLRSTQDRTLAEYVELFDLGSQNDFVEKTFVPALRMSSDSDIDSMRSALIDHVEHMVVNRKGKKQRDRNVRQMKTEKFISKSALVELAKVQPDVTLDLVGEMVKGERGLVDSMRAFFLKPDEPMTAWNYHQLYPALIKLIPLTGSVPQAQELVRRVQYLTIWRLLRERPDFETFQAAARFLTQFEAMSFTVGRKQTPVAATGPAARTLAYSVLALGARMTGVDPTPARQQLAAFAPPVAIRLHLPRFRGAGRIDVAYSQASEDLLVRLFQNGFQMADYQAFTTWRRDLFHFVPHVLALRITPTPVRGPLDEAGAREFLNYLINNPDEFDRASDENVDEVVARWIFELARAHNAFKLLDAPEVVRALERNPYVRTKLEALL